MRVSLVLLGLMACGALASGGEAAVDAAREYIQSLGLYGPVSAERSSLAVLPLAETYRGCLADGLDKATGRATVYKRMEALEKVLAAHKDNQGDA
jgi:hypothetical protein